MEDLIKTLVIALCSVVTAIAGAICAWLKKKVKALEKEKNRYKQEKHNKEKEIQVLHNGFRENVYNQLVEIRKKIETKQITCEKCKSRV